MLFWVITQRVEVIYYRRFGTTYRSHLQRRSRTQKTSAFIQTSWFSRHNAAPVHETLNYIPLLHIQTVHFSSPSFFAFHRPVFFSNLPHQEDERTLPGNFKIRKISCQLSYTKCSAILIRWSFYIISVFTSSPSVKFIEFNILMKRQSNMSVCSTSIQTIRITITNYKTLSNTTIYIRQHFVCNTLHISVLMGHLHWFFLYKNMKRRFISSLLKSKIIFSYKRVLR